MLSSPSQFTNSSEWQGSVSDFVRFLHAQWAEAGKPLPSLESLTQEYRRLLARAGSVPASVKAYVLLGKNHSRSNLYFVGEQLHALAVQKLAGQDRSGVLASRDKAIRLLGQQHPGYVPWNPFSDVKTTEVPDSGLEEEAIAARAHFYEFLSGLEELFAAA